MQTQETLKEIKLYRPETHGAPGLNGFVVESKPVESKPAESKPAKSKANDAEMEQTRPSEQDREWAAAIESGVGLEEIVEKAICVQVSGMLRDAKDEASRSRALAELHKLAKLLEQKRNRKERTSIQQERLRLLQLQQETKLRQMEIKVAAPARIATPAKIEAPAKVEAPAKIALPDK